MKTRVGFDAQKIYHGEQWQEKLGINFQEDQQIRG